MRYHRTGQDNWQPRQPSGLLRQDIHGPLQGMDEPADAHPLAWLALLVFIAAVVTLIAAALP